jgi:hypothetical protein
MNVEMQNEQDSLMLNAVDLLKNRGFNNIRANHSDYEKPASLKQKGSEKTFVPDLTARQDESKCYFEIVRKDENDKKEQVKKWSLLSTLAKFRNGSFFLLVPHGKLNYTRQIVEYNSIEAEILKI